MTYTYKEEEKVNIPIHSLFLSSRRFDGIILLCTLFFKAENVEENVERNVEETTKADVKW